MYYSYSHFHQLRATATYRIHVTYSLYLSLICNSLSIAVDRPIPTFYPSSVSDNYLSSIKNHFYILINLHRLSMPELSTLWLLLSCFLTRKLSLIFLYQPTYLLKLIYKRFPKLLISFLLLLLYRSCCTHHRWPRGGTPNFVAKRVQDSSDSDDDQNCLKYLFGEIFGNILICKLFLSHHRVYNFYGESITNQMKIIEFSLAFSRIRISGLLQILPTIQCEIGKLSSCSL